MALRTELPVDDSDRLLPACRPADGGPALTPLTPLELDTAPGGPDGDVFEALEPFDVLEPPVPSEVVVSGGVLVRGGVLVTAELLVTGGVDPIVGWQPVCAGFC